MHGKWRKDIVLPAFSMLEAGFVTLLPGMEGYRRNSSEEIRDMLQKGDSETDPM